MKRVLFATDFSASCDNALAYLQGILEGSSTSIDLIHVYDIPSPVMNAIPESAIATLIASRKETAIERLEKLQTEKLLPRQRGSVHAVYGAYAASDITDMARSVNADMIVMSLREKYNLLDRIMGSVTAHTITLSDRPVMVIPYGAQYNGIRNILFPSTVDKLDQVPQKEEEALTWLMSFWSIFGHPSIHMVHIQEMEQVNKADITFKNEPYTEVDYTRSYASSIEDGLIDFLGKNKCDMLAFHKPRRPFWERVYHHSVTRKLLKDSKIPVMIFS